MRVRGGKVHVESKEPRISAVIHATTEDEPSEQSAVPVPLIYSNFYL